VCVCVLFGGTAAYRLPPASGAALVSLGDRTLRRLDELEREANPSLPTLEVEKVIFNATARSHLGDPGSASLLIDGDGRTVGAALHYNHEELPFVQYIAALFLDHRFRGQGLGRSAFDSVVADARARSGRPYVAWIVHPENVAMLKLSRGITTQFGVDEEKGYLQFIDPDS
jgi:GNAT superfamily N-acetyltransferase